MKLIVGLGNPGNEYRDTRHNIGFMVLDHLAQKYNVSFNKEKFSGLYTEVFINNEKVILLKPCKYMNLSGEVIKKIVEYFKIDIENILVVVDDMSYGLGKFKLRYKGSSGGHNGLLDIEKKLKTQKYKRLKIGIGQNELIDKKNYVLGKLNSEEQKVLNNNMNIYIEIIEDFVKIDFLKLMNKYNGTN